MKKNGFSLIEVLICIVIIAVGLLALSRLNALLYNEQASARQRSEAQQLLQQTTENLRSITSYGTSSQLTVGNHTSAQTFNGGSGAEYSIGWTVANACTAPTGGTCGDAVLVVATVSWVDITGNQSLSARTLFHTN
ncbi:type IV pilus modification PilV family protein [Chitiniphilus shinanonensis]|uniref:type IV pilus modification PilV family protein n=1 Tax=Chitiniphilus shinanonensis TaxID=553088 RepID=UPI0012FBE3D1|nr:prepilin-type N-terminal cleavage/methylation domain-containing protein [Chitiniphilus shinanonensis]